MNQVLSSHGSLQGFSIYRRVQAKKPEEAKERFTDDGVKEEKKIGALEDAEADVVSARIQVSSYWYKIHPQKMFKMYQLGYMSD